MRQAGFEEKRKVRKRGKQGEENKGKQKEKEKQEKGGGLLVGVEEESITCNLEDPATASIEGEVFIKFSWVFYWDRDSNFFQGTKQS